MKNKNMLVFVFIVILFCVQQVTAKVIWLEESALDYEIYDLVLSNDVMLFDSSDVYFHNNIALLPFNSVVSALELNINYYPKNKIIMGKINGNDINLSLLNPQEEFDWDIVLLSQNEQVFIDYKTLAEIIDANIKIDNPNLSISLRSKKNIFPLESRIARIQRKIIKPHQVLEPEYSFIINDQYRVFTPPSGNISLALTASETNNTYNANINTFNDILFHSSNFSMAKNKEGDLKSRLTFTRSKSNPVDKLIGNINTYSFGDASASNIRTGSSYTGLGLVFSSFEQRYNNIFGKVTIEEYATANWQAELYQNGFLIDTGTVNEDGRIIFKDVETHYGNNRFEIKTYGSFGEEKTIIRDILIGQNLLKPGEFKYKGGVFDTNHSLLNTNNMFNSDFNFSPASFFQTEYGLNNKTSLGLSVFIEKDLKNDTTSKEAIVSATHQLSNALLNYNFKFQGAQSYNVDSNLIGSLGQWTHYQLGIRYSNDYRILGSDETQPDKFGFNGSINGRIGSVGYGFSGSTNNEVQQQGESSNNSKQNQFNNILSWRYKKIKLSNTLSRIQINNSHTHNITITDHLSASIDINNKFHFRATSEFDLKNNNSGGKFK